MGYGSFYLCGKQIRCESGISIYVLYWNVLGSLFCSNSSTTLCMGICFHFTSLKYNLIGVGVSFVTNEIGTKITNEFIENEIEAFRLFMTLSTNLIGYAAK